MHLAYLHRCFRYLSSGIKLSCIFTANYTAALALELSPICKILMCTLILTGQNLSMYCSILYLVYCHIVISILLENNKCGKS